MAQRSQEVAPATINRALSFLRRVFNVAIADGKADRNPVRAVKFFKENNERVRFLTEGRPMISLRTVIVARAYASLTATIRRSGVRTR